MKMSWVEKNRKINNRLFGTRIRDSRVGVSRNGMPMGCRILFNSCRSNPYNEGSKLGCGSGGVTENHIPH